MNIVIDTTEVFADLLLKGPNFVLLRSYIARNSAKLYVPSLVLEEAINHYREHLSRHVRSAKAELSSIEGLMTSDKSIPMLELDEAICVTEFRVYLESRIKWIGGEVIEFKKVTVESLLLRSLERRKPFDGEGRKGFRDALLWETVLREIVQGQSDDKAVALITKNSKDFGKNGTLDDELQRDCVSAGGNCDTVTLYDGLTAFVAKEIKPQLEKLDTILRSIQEDGEFQEFQPRNFFLEYRQSIELEVDAHLRGMKFPTLATNHEYHSYRLKQIETLFQQWEVDDVWKVDSERIACGLTFSTPAKIECHERKSEYYPDEDEVFLHEWEDVFVGEVRLKIEMIAILNQNNGSVEEHEVCNVDVEFNSEWRR